jgi:uncharacterized protein (DUF362 family)
VTRRWTRRELVGLAAGAGLAARGANPVAADVVTHPGTVAVASLKGNDAGVVDPGAARSAMAAVLAGAMGSKDGVEAARRLFSPKDIVGIKVNCLAGRRLSPRVELVAALADLIAEAGVARNRIIVFERHSRELRRAGYTEAASAGRFRVVGVDNDYDRMPSTSGKIGSCFARLVSTTCSALVSFGVVKDHDLAGISAGLKNWYGVIHNPNKYHDGNCNPYVADVVNHRYVRDKLRLTVLDGVVAQFHGGPALRAANLFPLARLAASTDPVAADVWAWREVDAERSRQGLPTVSEAGRPPRFVDTAASYGLGVAAPEIVEVEPR